MSQGRRSGRAVGLLRDRGCGPEPLRPRMTGVVPVIGWPASEAPVHPVGRPVPLGGSPRGWWLSTTRRPLPMRVSASPVLPSSSPGPGARRNATRIGTARSPGDNFSAKTCLARRDRSTFPFPQSRSRPKRGTRGEPGPERPCPAHAATHDPGSDHGQQRSPRRFRGRVRGGPGHRSVTSGCSRSDLCTRVPGGSAPET